MSVGLSSNRPPSHVAVLSRSAPRAPWPGGGAGTQAEPFSTLTACSIGVAPEHVVKHEVGQGVHDRPLRRRRPVETATAGGRPASAARPSARTATGCSPDSAPWKATGTPASASRAQMGSKYGSPSDRPPTGAKRTATARAPRSSTSSSSKTARSRSTRVSHGAAKMRCLVVEAPFVVEPPVEGVEIGRAGLGVVAELDLNGQPETWPHGRRLDPHLVHPFAGGPPVGRNGGSRPARACRPRASGW